MDFLEGLFDAFERKRKPGHHDEHYKTGHDSHGHDDHSQWGGHRSHDDHHTPRVPPPVAAAMCCGRPLPDNAQFCPGCGKSVKRPRICQQCGATPQEGANFCHSCGQPLR